MNLPLELRGQTHDKSEFIDAALSVELPGEMPPSITFVMSIPTVVFVALLALMPIMPFVPLIMLTAAFRLIIAVVYSDPLNHRLIAMGCLKGDVSPKNLVKLNGMLRATAFYIEVMGHPFVIHINIEFCVMRVANVIVRKKMDSFDVPHVFQIDGKLLPVFPAVSWASPATNAFPVIIARAD